MKPKKIKIKTILLAILILLVLLIATVFLMNYFLGKNNFLSKPANKILPFPAAIVGMKEFISIKLVTSNLQAVQRFYENQDFSQEGLRVDFSTEDGQKRLKIKEKNVLNKLIENQIIEKLALENGIKITPELVSQEVNRKILELGDRSGAQENILKLYGWNLEQFKLRIVQPEMYKEKLAAKIFAQKDYSENIQKKIKEAKAKLDAKIDFANVVKEFSEGESVKNNGDLGWFSAEQMLPEISSVVFSMEKGMVSGIIQSQLGLHIIKIDDKKIENGVPMIKVSQIFVRTPNFADWLIGEGKKIPVKIMITDYVWNKESSRLEFKDEDLKKFEENLYLNSPDDASMMFD